MYHTHVPIKRITVSMPEYVYQRLQQLPKGQISQFVTKSVQNELVNKEALDKEKKSSIDELIEFSRSLPPTPWEQIKKAIEKGRM